MYSLGQCFQVPKEIQAINIKKAAINATFTIST